MINYTATYTDHYQLTMSQVCFLKGQKDNHAIFDYFFRKLPFDAGYAVFAGLEDLLNALEILTFDKQDLDFLKGKGFHPEFMRYLKKFRFTGNIYSSCEGDIVFPTSPILQVEANIIEAQIIETILLNILNFQTLIATKASRMRQAAGESKLIDFGLRRAQGAGGYYASRASFIGGADAITLADEKDVDIMYHPLNPLKSLSVKKYNKEPLLQKVMGNGVRLSEPQSLSEIAKYSRER